MVPGFGCCEKKKKRNETKKQTVGDGIFIYVLVYIRKSRGKRGSQSAAATAALSIRINVLGFPGSAMFSRDAFSDQSAIIFHAPMVCPAAAASPRTSPPTIFSPVCIPSLILQYRCTVVYRFPESLQFEYLNIHFRENVPHTVCLNACIQIKRFVKKKKQILKVVITFDDGF